MLNLYDKLVMDAAAINAEAKARRKYYKHIGELKEDHAKVAILFRTIPNEPEACLVIGPKFLSDVQHNDFMRALESAEAQASFELGTYLARQRFSDGTNMLAVLHQDNFIKRMSTKDIIVTYGPGDEGKISLDKLNQMIADDLKLSIADLAVKEDVVISKKPKTNKKSNGKETAKN
jgi:hypothetical protein